MHRKDCTKILGNPHSKSGSGRHPGNPHRNHDSTPQSQCNPVSIRRLCQDGNSDRNRHNQIELQQDCKTAKDCQWIKGIAQNSWEIHKLQAIVPNCPRTGLPSQSVSDQSATHPKPCNARTIFCNPDDCGGSADSRQSHHNPVSTRPNPSSGLQSNSLSRPRIRHLFSIHPRSRHN